MADEKSKTPEWLKALQEVREKEDDPVVDGLVNIGSHTLDATERLDKRIDKSDEKLDEIQRRAAKDRESIEAQMEAGFKTVAARVDSLSKRQIISAGGNANVFSSSDRLLAAIPENQKHLVYDAERKIRADERSDRTRKIYSGPFKDPAAVALSELWMKTAAQLQLPRYFGGKQGELSERLEKYSRAFDEVSPVPSELKAAYSGATDGPGGYTVPILVASEVLRIAEDSGVVVSRARHIPMAGDTLQIPNENTGITVYWPAQGGTLTAGESDFGINQLDAKKLAARAAASIEVVSDSVIGLIPYVQTIMAEKIGKTLDGEALEGTGTNFTGVNSASGINTVATTTTDGEQLAFLDLVNAVYAADESSVEDGAAWFMHRKIFATVVALVDSQGRPIFQPQVSGASPGTLLGFPVYTTSAIATNTTRGATGNTSNVYFGDPRRLIFGDNIGMRFDVTETGPGWEFFQVDMRLVTRHGFTVGTPAAFSRIVGCTQL